jgi:hypothetical protein
MFRLLQTSSLIDVAQTGFEFHKRRAVPSVEGIVVAQENADMLLDVRPFSCSRLRLKWSPGLLGIGAPSDREGFHEEAGAVLEALEDAHQRPSHP